MTPAQLRAARKLAGLTRFRLGQRCGVPEATVRVYEDDGRMVSSTDLAQTPEQRIALLRSTLEAAGIVFTDGDEPGVRLRTAAE